MAGKIGELNVGLTIDQTDITATIRGLKAIQREAKKATQALRELQGAEEIERLAAFLLREYPGEPGKHTSESAVDVAIRLLSKTEEAGAE
ncbi:hypothetical protein P4H42_03545 [Paenibacillus macerans]|uniref:hypothetical protein n=1 Tax=Paenibacillus macerans TaxID=44252 RepID=UPI002DB6EE76|nr:hypothetical protein [Paenibacillus macerans]MEC0328696.1 hypothetical protein [Paenibacillus macerans]